MRVRRKRLKVLHVIPSVAACRGGPSKAVIDMVSSLNGIGLDAQIATTNDDGPTELDVPLNRLIDYNGAPTRFFRRFSPPLNPVREFAYSNGFRKWLRHNIGKYDLIHVHAIFSYCSSYAMYLARKRGIPYIVRPIGQLQHWSLQQSHAKKNLYLKLLERANIESATAIHFTAESEKQEAGENFTLNGKVIPLGINIPKKSMLTSADFAQIWALSPSELTILYLSRLHKKKGLELLLQALSSITTGGFKLLIAGDGEPGYKAKLISLCVELGLEKKCHFLGHVNGDKKTALLQHSDLFALTSYSENFGISVLEAMANGLTPLVSTEVALSSIIAEQQLGLVCNTDVSDIESQLRFALNNQSDIKSMGAKAEQYTAAHYSWSGIANQLKLLYNSVNLRSNEHG